MAMSSRIALSPGDEPLHEFLEPHHVARVEQILQLDGFGKLLLRLPGRMLEIEYLQMRDRAHAIGKDNEHVFRSQTRGGEHDSVLGMKVAHLFHHIPRARPQQLRQFHPVDRRLRPPDVGITCGRQIGIDQVLRAQRVHLIGDFAQAGIPRAFHLDCLGLADQKGLQHVVEIPGQMEQRGLADANEA